MNTSPFFDWTRVATETWLLGLEAGTVIGLRMARFASGGAAANREVQLMLSEKIGSAIELQTALMTGGLGATPLSGTQATLRHYRRKVRANRLRLQ